MIGIIEQVLRERYGEPHVVPGTAVVEYRWNEERESLRCVLYKLAEASPGSDPQPLALRRMYGDAIGGSLLLGSLKLATIQCPSMYGLYLLRELHVQPEVGDAKRIDSAIEFFMDAGNVWFYGLKDDDLYVYDAGAGELDRLGSAKEALSALLDEWEQAKL
jgi:hypothetical protein